MIRFPSSAALAAVLALAIGLVSIERADAQSPVPTTSPTPTVSPADPSLARQYANDGKVDAAAGAYLAVIAEGTDEERLAARIELAKVYLDDAQPLFASQQLEAFLLEAPEGTDVRNAQYLIAEALLAQGRYADALPLYDAYIQEGGGATLYARVSRAEALLQLGRTQDAVTSGEALLNEPLPGNVRLRLILAMARGLEADRPSAAVVWYDRLREESGSPNDQALALWQAALIERDLGDTTAANSAALTITERYPGTATALEVVEDYPSGAPLPGTYQTGLVYYLNGASDDARGAFESIVADDATSPAAARAAFYLAVLDERDGDMEGALANYERSYAIDPTTELADDTLWWRARLLEMEGRVEEARAEHERLASSLPDSGFGIESRFRAALLAYDAGELESAEDGFAAIARGSDNDTRQRALLWQGKALDAQGDNDDADEIWRALLADAPEDYYGLRAGVLLGETGGDASEADLDETASTEWGAIETWVRASADVDLAAAFDGLLYNAHWGLAQELRALGQDRDASAELAALLEDADDDAAELYTLARYTAWRDAPDISSRAAARLLNAVPESARESAPPGLLRIAYPAPNAELLKETLDGSNVPNLLMLALVRQESFFDPLAGSSAGALGLTQVVPPTGEEIASALEIGTFEVDDLFFPAVSLQFGAYYLDQQLELFDGNMYEALAAYNAGPGNAQRWAEAADGDVDRFVEEIEFGQTDAYVKLVSENLARYRQLYLGLDAPALPED